jgi:heme/copper-type cytochrome/quinol oxidase subunit 2
MHFRQVFGQTFGLETTIAEVVFGLVMATVVASLLLSWWRRRRGRPAARKSEANLLELSYVLCLAGIAAFLVLFSFTQNASFWRDPPAPMHVRVTALQWCWRFNYSNPAVTVTARCSTGPLPTLVLPAGRPVKLDITSADVIHSVWVPALRVKIYAYPGHVNGLTLDLPAGRWLGRCSEFCGLYHTGMEFYLQAVPPAEFTRWLAAGGRHAPAAGGAR